MFDEMAVRFVFLGTLREFAGHVDEVEARGATLSEALQSLRSAEPALGDSICDEHGRVRELINVFVGGREVRSLEGERTRLRDGDRVIVVPSVAGGEE